MILSKILLGLLIMFSFCLCIAAQEKDTQKSPDLDVITLSQNQESEEFLEEVSASTEQESASKNEVDGNLESEITENSQTQMKKAENTEENSLRPNFLSPKFDTATDEMEEPIEESPQIENSDSVNEEKFHWKSALKESFYFLGIQHGFRMFQKKTTDELGGPFFRDWGKSVKNLGGWRDGDSAFTNYIAHPMQGAVTGRIFINNSDKAKKQEFGNSKKYWNSRLKAMAWSAAWSTQFELGPISEASIGNVGLYDRVGPNRMGWVDMVVTPTAGTAVLIGEDIIDKYILKKWLEKGNSKTRIKIFRTFFTPFQSFTNVLGGKVPWKRYNR